jgi:hypothetical protein
MALGFSVAMDFRLRRVISQALGFQPSTGFSAKHWVFSQALGFQPSTGFSAKHWVFSQALGFQPSTGFLPHDRLQ